MPQNEKDKYPKPNADGKDAAYALAKSAISVLPLAGGAAAEVFGTLVESPISRRRDDWVESIARGLQELEEKVEELTIGKLQDDDSFVSTLIHASQIAIRNHRKDRLDALRNAVLNAAVETKTRETARELYMQLIDTLTPYHVLVLDYFASISKSDGIQGSERNWAGTHNPRFKEKYPNVESHESLLNQAIKDLEDRGLIEIERDVQQTETATRKTEMVFVTLRVTGLGIGFSRFVKPPVLKE